MTTYTTDWDETFTITHRIGTYGNEKDLNTIIEAHDENGNLASELYADITTGQIMQVETRKENRGEGIATALVQYAVDNGIALYHSPLVHCTEDGAAFVAKADMIDEIDPELAYNPDAA